MKRGEVVREWTGLGGERGGKNEEKRVGAKGPESTLEKLWFWYPIWFRYSLVWRLFYRVHCIGSFGNSCEFWRLSLKKTTKLTKIHHNSGVLAVCANYDGFLWVFPKKKSSEFAWIPEIPETMHPQKKSPISVLSIVFESYGTFLGHCLWRFPSHRDVLRYDNRKAKSIRQNIKHILSADTDWMSNPALTFSGMWSTNWRPSPHPIKTIHMAQKGGFVCHIWVRMPYFL